MRRQIHVRHRGSVNREGKRRAKMLVRKLGKIWRINMEHVFFSPSVLTRMIPRKWPNVVET